MGILPMRAAAIRICRGPDQMESMEKPAPERSEAGFVFVPQDRRLTCQKPEVTVFSTLRKRDQTAITGITERHPPSPGLCRPVRIVFLQP